MERPFVVAELDHVVLRCREQARMVRFYTEILGLAEERRVDAIGLVQLRAGRSLVDLVPAGPDAAPPGSRLDHFCLDVAGTDMAGLTAYLTAAGIVPLAAPMRTYGAHGFGLSVYVRDPEDNVVELKVATDDA